MTGTGEHVSTLIKSEPSGLRVEDFVAPAATDSSILDCAVILPTYNERENIPLVIERLHAALHGLAWEAIFVDDDSPDGTAEVIGDFAREDPRIRLIHRLGRRGLSSACIEGMLSTQAAFIGVMDADLQHDETILPRMLERLRGNPVDVVVATRNAEGGGMGDFSPWRVSLSRMGRKISEAACQCSLSDPMSGFFMLRRGFLLEVMHGLQGGGFKILVDLLASSPRPVNVAEIGYTFGARRHGESKLNVVVGIEYLFLIANKLLGGVVPIQAALFIMVGGLGLLTHLTTLLVLTRVFHVHFVAAQIAATLVAMVENFLLNNIITFRDRCLVGARILPGAIRFVLACSFGAWANIVFTRALWQAGAAWYLAGLAGIIIGSVWNFSISSFLTWGPQRLIASRSEEKLHAFTGRVGASR